MNGRDIYLVYGWMAGPADLKSIMSDMAPEILEKDLRILFMEDGTKGAFVGKVLSFVNRDEGAVHASTPLPSARDLERIREGMDILGLSELARTEPKLWTALG